MNKDADILAEVEKLSKEIDDTVQKQGRHVFRRYPILLGSLSTFGLVAVLYGFEGVINRIPFFVDHPLALFFLGVVILLITGTVYKKLSL